MKAFSDSNNDSHFQAAEMWKKNTPDKKSFLNFIIIYDDYDDVNY